MNKSKSQMFLKFIRRQELLLPGAVLCLLFVFLLIACCGAKAQNVPFDGSKAVTLTAPGTVTLLDQTGSGLNRMNVRGGQFSIKISGGPSSVAVSIGVSAIDATAGNAISKLTSTATSGYVDLGQITGLWPYYTVTVTTLSGGTNPSITIYPAFSTTLFARGGGGAGSFDQLLGGTSTGKNFVIGAGSSLDFIGGGTNNASSYKGQTGPTATQFSYLDPTGPIQAQLDGKQAALGFTPENSANKSTDPTMADDSDTEYPSQKAVKTALLPFDLGTLTYNAGGTTTFAAASHVSAGGVVTATNSTSTTFSPTNLVKWGNYKVEIDEDSTGTGVTFTLGTGGSCSAWEISNGGSGAIDLTASPNAVDLLWFTFNGTKCIGVVAHNAN